MPVFSVFLSVISSRIGQVALALVVGYGWGWWKTDAGWRQSVAAERAQLEAKYQAELRRQAENAAEIAKAATQRAEEDAADLAKLQKTVEEFDRSQKNVKDSCAIDDAFHAAASKLRQPASRNRPAKITRPTK